MTTPMLATVAIRPLRRPLAPVRRAQVSVPALKVPVYLILELIFGAALLYLAYTAITDQWLVTGIDAMSGWYTEVIAPHFDPNLTVRTPPEMGLTGPSLVGREVGVFT